MLRWCKAFLLLLPVVIFLLPMGGARQATAGDGAPGLWTSAASHSHRDSQNGLTYAAEAFESEHSEEERIPRTLSFALLSTIEDPGAFAVQAPRSVALVQAPLAFPLSLGRPRGPPLS